MHSRLNWNLELLVLRRGESQITWWKTSWNKQENQQQTQPTYGFDAGIWPRTILVGGECSHHCTTLAPHTVALRCSCSLSVLLCTQPSTLMNIRQYAEVSPVSSVTVSGSMLLPELSWLCTPLSCCFFSTGHGVFKELCMPDLCHMNLLNGLS